MGKLIRNGIEYGGGNGTDIFEVTQAEYDALVQAGTLIHNALYVITDAPNLNETAEDISYDGGADTVWDKVEAKATIVDMGRIDNTSKTITFSATVRLLICSFGGSDNRFGEYIAFGRASTSFAQTILSSSAVTVTASNNTITITTNTSNIYFSLIILSGDVDDFVIT